VLMLNKTNFLFSCKTTKMLSNDKLLYGMGDIKKYHIYINCYYKVLL